MKKTLSLMLALLLLILCGCHTVKNEGTVAYSNDVYSIIDYGGEYAIRFRGQNQVSSSGAQMAEPVYPVDFASPKEMKDAVKSGSLFSSHLYTMRKFQRNSAGEVLIYDIHSLCDAVLPDGLQYDNIEWFGGKSYAFVWDRETMYGRLKVDSEAAIKEIIESEFYVEKGTAKITSTETVADRNATVVYFLNLGGTPCKSVRYTYKDEGKDLIITEFYHSAAPDSVPDSIRVGGSVNGIYFYATIHNFTERPSYEWITSFDLKPYVEAETE